MLAYQLVAPDEFERIFLAHPLPPPRTFGSKVRATALPGFLNAGHVGYDNQLHLLVQAPPLNRVCSP
jgi:hypothetical protein